MKTLKYILVSLLFVSVFTACTEFEDELTGDDAIEGGELVINNRAIGYVVGNDGTYTASGSVYQGAVQVKSIEIYKSFTEPATVEGEDDKVSNEVLLTTVDVNNTTVGESGEFQLSFKYEDLIEGLTLDGQPLSTNDGDLNIGDFFKLRYAATTSRGNVITNSVSTKVSVGTRFAGLYKALSGAYYRIGAGNSDRAGEWPEATLIESVDATTYRVVDYFGLFNGNEWYFQIDSNDVISYPQNTPSGDPQLGNGQPFMTCLSNPQDFNNVECNPTLTNIVVRDDVGGKDQLIMTYGYLTGGSDGNEGPREFYHVLEKIVD